MRIKHSFGLALTMLGLMMACGGGSTTPFVLPPTQMSSGLSYTNPTGTGWRLVKDASSTSTHLVLNLVGPTGKKGRGVGFNLRSDGSVKFSKFANGAYLKDLGVFQLGNSTGAIDLNGNPVTTDVVAMVGGLKEGGKLLSVGAYQKDRRYPAQNIDTPLYQIAIDYDPTAVSDRMAGTKLSLAFVKGRSIPEYIGDNPDSPTFDPNTILSNYVIEDIQVAVGTLSTR